MPSTTKVTDLPHRVCMFASFSCAHEDWTMLVLHHVVDCHAAIVESCTNQIRLLWMEVKTHDTRFCLEDVLGMGGILQSPELDHAIALLQEVI